MGCEVSAGQHTPGPWATAEVGDKPFTCLAVMNSERVSLFTLVEEDGVEFAAVMEEADARLIAAAPDLLTALRAVMKEHQSGYGLQCESMVRAAIAKATGAAA